MFTPEKLSCSTNAFLLNPLSDAIEKIAELGFKNIEIFCDYPHLYAENFRFEDLIALEKLLSQLNLKISNMNANTMSGNLRNFKRLSADEGPSLLSNSKDERKKRIDYTKKIMKIAKDLNAENISISSGTLDASLKFKKGLENFINSLNSILDFAERLKILVGIEPEPRHLISNTKTLELVFSRVKSKLLGVNFDIGHSYLTNENIPREITKLNKKIFNIHIEDIKDKKHKHLPLGDGNINFMEIFKTLNKIQYERYVTLELYSCYKNPVQAIRRSLIYLKNNFDHIDVGDKSD